MNTNENNLENFIFYYDKLFYTDRSLEKSKISRNNLIYCVSFCLFSKFLNSQLLFLKKKEGEKIHFLFYDFCHFYSTTLVDSNKSYWN